MRRALWFPLLLLALVAGAAARPECALACTCIAPLDVEQALADSDAAFVGRLVERRDERQGPLLNSGDPVTFVFAVDRVHKGELGRRVEVVSAAESASCGLGVSPGAEVGLFLDREGDRWRSGLCSQVPPEQFASAGWTGYAPIATPEDREEAASAFRRSTVLLLIAAVVVVAGLFLIRRKLRPE